MIFRPLFGKSLQFFVTLGVLLRCFHSANHEAEFLASSFADDPFQRVDTSVCPPTEKPEHLDIVSRHRLVGDSWPYTPVEAGFDPCVARDILADAEATCGSVTGVHSRLYHTYTTFEGRYLLGGTLESVLIIATVNPRS